MILPFIAAAAEQLPELRPPLEPLPPSTWEQLGPWGVAGVVLFLVADVAALVWWLGRNLDAPPPSPVERARGELRSLTAAPEGVALAAAVSMSVRRYVSAAVVGGGAELTSEETSRAVTADGRFDVEQTAQLGGLLRDCDRRMFAPTAPPASAGPKLAERALELVESFDKRLHPPSVDS